MNYILKLCGWYPSRVDALSGDFVQRHARAIATQIPVVVLFAIKDEHLQSATFQLEMNQEGNLTEYIYYYPKRKLLDGIWSQWYYMQILKDFINRTKLLTEKPLIVHTSVLWKSAIWVNYLNKRIKIKFVVTEHSTAYLPNALNFFERQNFLRKRIVRKAVENSKMLLPVSAHLGKALQQLFGAKATHVIKNVVDTQLFYYPDKNTSVNEPFQFVHISTMGYQKNIEGIKNVLLKLAQIQTNFFVTMIGEPPQNIKQELEQHASLKNKILFTGNITYAEVAAYLRQADGLFLFSRFENMPCVILEALCCGVPVVSTNVGGIAEVIDDTNGELVISEDEDGLLSALQRMISREKPYDRKQIAADATAKFNYQQIGAEFMEAYKSVLDKSAF